MTDWIDRETRIMLRIARATGEAEKRFLIALGVRWYDADIAGMATTSRTYKMLLADERPAVNLEARTITGKAPA